MMHENFWGPVAGFPLFEGLMQLTRAQNPEKSSLDNFVAEHSPGSLFDAREKLALIKVIGKHAAIDSQF